MSIPKETNKELFVVLEDESATVTISPPVVDYFITFGAQLPADQNTMIFQSITGEDVLLVKTLGGLQFSIGGATAVTPPASRQQAVFDEVLTGSGDPNVAGIDGKDNGLYIDTDTNTILGWSS